MSGPPQSLAGNHEFTVLIENSWLLHCMMTVRRRRGWRLVVLVFVSSLLKNSSSCSFLGGADTRAPCSLPAKTYGLECREVEWKGSWSSVGQITKHDSELLHPCKCAQLSVRECKLDRLYFQRCWMHLRLRGGSFGISDQAGETNAAGGNNAAGGEASLASLALERNQSKDSQDTCGSADGADDGGAGAMDMTETLEPSVERVETSHPGTPHAAPVREEGTGGAGEASGTTSVEELSIGSPTATVNRAGLGSSYMAMASSLGGVSGEGGSGGSGAMGSSSTVKTYRHPTSSKQRNLIREKIAKALSPFYREGEDKYSPLTAAIAMEHSSYRYFGKDEANERYLDKARSILWNIKDPKNPQLRRRILDGSLQPERLALMETPEMASDALKQQRKIYAALAMKAATLGNVEDEHAATDMFFCRKCKKRKCTYYQMQTRSADEPMTTFVTCLNCGNRWKE